MSDVIVNMSTDLPTSDFSEFPLCASDGSTEAAEAIDAWMDDWWQAKYAGLSFSGISRLWKGSAPEGELAMAGAVGLGSAVALLIREKSDAAYRAFAQGRLRRADQVFGEVQAAYVSPGEPLQHHHDPISVALAAKAGLMRQGLKPHLRAEAALAELPEGTVPSDGDSIITDLREALAGYEYLTAWPHDLGITEAEAYQSAGIAALARKLSQLPTWAQRRDQVKAVTGFAEASYLFLQMGNRPEAQRLLAAAIDVLPDGPSAEMDQEIFLRTNLGTQVLSLTVLEIDPHFKKAMALLREGETGAAAQKAAMILPVLEEALSQVAKIQHTGTPQSALWLATVHEAERTLCQMAISVARLQGDRGLEARYWERAMANARLHVVSPSYFEGRLGRFSPILLVSPLEAVVPDLLDTPLPERYVRVRRSFMNPDTFLAIIDAHPWGAMTVRYVAAQLQAEGRINVATEGGLVEVVQEALTRGSAVTPASLASLYFEVAGSDGQEEAMDRTAMQKFLADAIRQEQSSAEGRGEELRTVREERGPRSDPRGGKPWR